VFAAFITMALIPEALRLRQQDLSQRAARCSTLPDEQTLLHRRISIDRKAVHALPTLQGWSGIGNEWNSADRPRHADRVISAGGPGRDP
jgi:hypothetical protein